jgi:histidinol-phosphatase
VTNSDLPFALELADLAADVSMRMFRRAGLRVENKADGSPVTEVDRTVEDVLRDALARYHPSDRVVGEEFGGEPSSGRCWYLDPIEGTSLYIEGSLWWSTLISLAVDGVVTTGVVDYPAAERRYWAVRGDGAFANGDPMQVSSVAQLTKATVCDDYRHNLERATPGHPLVRLAGRCSTVHPYQGGHSMLVVASGEADVALDSGGGPWDYAPFVILVEEAGGVASDIQGQARFDGGSLLATNGRLHSQVLTTLASSLQAAPPESSFRG